MTPPCLTADLDAQSPNAELASETLSSSLGAVRLGASFDPASPNAELICPPAPVVSALTLLTLTEAQLLALTEAQLLSLVEQ